MSNIINSQINYDNNPIAAQKLKDKQTGSRKNMGLINLPETTYKYSTDTYSNEMQEIRKEAAYDNYLYEEQQKKQDKFFSILLAGLYSSIAYLVIKNIKIPRNILKFCK